MELYSYDKYRGFDIYVELFVLEDGSQVYEGTAFAYSEEVYSVSNGTSGEQVRLKLMEMVDEDLV